MPNCGQEEAEICSVKWWCPCVSGKDEKIVAAAMAAISEDLNRRRAFSVFASALFVKPQGRNSRQGSQGASTTRWPGRGAPRGDEGLRSGWPQGGAVQCGRLYAVGDACTHAGVRLSEGWLYDGRIECALHRALFDVASGVVLAPPARLPVPTHEVRVEGGDVYVAGPAG